MPTVILRPEDVLISLFHFFPGDRREFAADRELLHRSLYNLKQEEPRLFEEFTFNTDKIFPSSDVLDQALNNLEFSGYLKKYNPLLDHYKIEPVVDKYFEENLSQDFEIYRAKLQSLSAELQRYLFQEEV